MSDRTTAVTTTLAAVFNLGAILVVCFGLMPRVDRAADEAVRSRAEIEANRRQLEENRAIQEAQWKDLDRHRRVVDRLTEILDAAAKKAEEAKKKKMMMPEE